MKNPSLERFYLKIDKAILLTQSYTEIDGLYFIIKSCRLKPYNIFYNKEKYSLILYRKWFDEFGNTLNIIKGPKVKLLYNDLSLRKIPIISTDLYFGLSLDKVAKLSSLVHIVIGINEDTNDYYFIITFLGIDNYFRSYMYDYSKFEQISPLILGMKRLKNIIRNADIKRYSKLINKENYMIPCLKADEWISYMPMSEEFTNFLKSQYDIDFSFLK